MWIFYIIIYYSYTFDTELKLVLVTVPVISSVKFVGSSGPSVRLSTDDVDDMVDCS